MPNRVPPTLRLAVLCSHIERDSDGLVYSLIEPWHTIRVPAGDAYARPPTPAVYAQLADGVGTFYLSVQLRAPGGTVLYRSPVTEVTFDADRSEPDELVIELDGLAFPGPGRYEVHVVCNHTSFSDLRASAVPFPPLHVGVIPIEAPDGDGE